jgi:hypothetical protein
VTDSTERVVLVEAEQEPSTGRPEEAIDVEHEPRRRASGGESDPRLTGKELRAMLRRPRLLEAQVSASPERSRIAEDEVPNELGIEGVSGRRAALDRFEVVEDLLDDLRPIHRDLELGDAAGSSPAASTSTRSRALGVLSGGDR